MVIQSFEDLRIWKETHALAKEIHQLVKKYPPEEKYEIVPQLRRARIGPSQYRRRSLKRTYKRIY